jgi:hypothetical protein
MRAERFVWKERRLQERVMGFVRKPCVPTNACLGSYASLCPTTLQNLGVFLKSG